MSAPAIELDRLTKRFGGFTAVDGVSLELRAGEVLAFLGPNGAGKSTTMKMLTGTLPPTSGNARVMGVDVWARRGQTAGRVGYLPEGAPAYPEMAPHEFLRFCARARGLRGREVNKAVDCVASRTGLHGVLRQPIETLSKGYKRRVGLAQAILTEPPVLVLDEPTDGLDPNQKADVRALVRELAQSAAILFSTHLLEEVRAVCSRVVVIASGRVIADETPALLATRDPRAGDLDTVFRTLTKSAEAKP